MSQLDQVGRLVPGSLEVSRAAATRHAHLCAAREGRAHPRTRPPRPRPGWMEVVLARLSCP